MPVFVEPLPVERDKNGIYKILRSASEISKTIGIATALGGSSANIWLKIPYVKNFESVTLSTSCPILMLGGESTGNPLIVLDNFEKGLAAGKNVRGCLAGRNIIFPGDDDPRSVALAISKIIHDYTSTQEALTVLAENRGNEIDFLTSKFL